MRRQGRPRASRSIAPARGKSRLGHGRAYRASHEVPRLRQGLYGSAGLGAKRLP
ncbi:hypothetical protein [Acrocarpospora pleiomorpha]|uniref:hypothetical protein n=1 Tax=Acrocarpospora pleiomorpha TaxID=90975 RepID=UPI0012D337E9|nr:hypothetical protein [Acrocarpospora pleiomorpha]